MKIKIEIDVNLRNKEEFEVFGTYHRIHPDYTKTETGMKEHLIGQIATILEEYGSESYNNLTQHEIEIKDQIMNCIKIQK